MISQSQIDNFLPTYLYVKTHNVTGLKYFGKTTKESVQSYKGSGVYWNKHLKKHGNNVSTEILGHFTDPIWVAFYAYEFCEINGICDFDNKNNVWANLILENGLDGGQAGRKFTQEQLLRLRECHWAKGLSKEDNPNTGSKRTKTQCSNISNAKLENKKEKKQIAINDGKRKIFIDHDAAIPDGFSKGTIITEKMLLANKDTWKNLDEESKEKRKKSISIANSKPKPAGFGEKISAKQKGVPKPYMIGENNVSHREDVKRKISESHKFRKKITWFHDKNDKNKYFWVYADETDSIDLNVYAKGKPCLGEWYNDGEMNVFIRFDSTQDKTNLKRGKVKLHRRWVNDGIRNYIMCALNLPEGYKEGRLTHDEI
jgi:hypothetical protein